jgi:hypothetical protein
MNMPRQWMTMTGPAVPLRKFLFADLVAHATKMLGNLVTSVGVLGAGASCNVIESAHRLKFVMRFA